MKKQIKRFADFLKENNVNYSIETENGNPRFFLLQLQTDCSVQVLHQIDLKKYDTNSDDWYSGAMFDVYNDFDLDEEIELNREYENYRRRFRISQSVDDFRKYEDVTLYKLRILAYKHCKA